jgi:hypothetical protein
MLSCFGGICEDGLVENLETIPDCRSEELSATFKGSICSQRINVAEGRESPLRTLYTLAGEVILVSVEECIGRDSPPSTIFFS